MFALTTTGAAAAHSSVAQRQLGHMHVEEDTLRKYEETQVKACGMKHGVLLSNL